MTAPDRITLLRLILSPVFFAAYFFSDWVVTGIYISLVSGWMIFSVIELSDLLDGYLARKLGKSSELGKVLDPFADSVSRLTYFLCFVGGGIMPIWILLVLIYRDLSVAFVRLLSNRQGITMGARLTGKIKAVVYAAGGIAGMLRWSSNLLASGEFRGLRLVSDIIFICCAAIAFFSMADYIYSHLRRITKS